MWMDISLTWISRKTSTRLLILGVRFSSTSECCPARFCSLFCEPNTQQLQKNLHRNYNKSRKPQNRIFLLKYNAIQIRDKETHLKSVNKTCSILIFKSCKTRSSKQIKLLKLLTKEKQSRRNKTKSEKWKLPAVRSLTLKLSLSLLIFWKLKDLRRKRIDWERLWC